VFVVFVLGSDPNRYVFQLFRTDPNAPNAHVENFIQVVVLELGAVMNESAFDLTATISSHFLLWGCEISSSCPLRE